MIEPMTMKLPAKPTQRTGEPEAPARAGVPERFSCGKGRAYSEPARLRDQFTGRKRPNDSERRHQKNQNKTQNIARQPHILSPNRQAVWHNRIGYDSELGQRSDPASGAFFWSSNLRYLHSSAFHSFLSYSACARRLVDLSRSGFRRLCRLRQSR